MPRPLLTPSLPKPSKRMGSRGLSALGGVQGQSPWPSLLSPRHESALASQRAVFDAVGFGGVGAEAAALVFFIGLEVAFEPFDVAVALE